MQSHLFFIHCRGIPNVQGLILHFHVELFTKLRIITYVQCAYTASYDITIFKKVDLER